MNILRKGQDLGRGMTVQTDGYHAKRKEVIGILYALRDAGVKLPRLEVKIAEAGGQTIGLGYHNNPTIAISAELTGDKLYAVVLHEVVHTAFNYRGHDESCPLMASTVKTHSKRVYLQAFMKYAKAAKAVTK